MSMDIDIKWAAEIVRHKRKQSSMAQRDFESAQRKVLRSYGYSWDEIEEIINLSKECKK